MSDAFNVRISEGSYLMRIIESLLNVMDVRWLNKSFNRVYAISLMQGQYKGRHYAQILEDIVLVV